MKAPRKGGPAERGQGNGDLRPNSMKNVLVLVRHGESEWNKRNMFTGWQDVDLTGDYWFKSDFEGSTSGFCADGLPCTSSDKSSVEVFLLLANAYVDLGTYNGFTPYVGAGIGGAYVKWDELTNTTRDGSFKHEGGGDWRFAYAAMAGVSYCLTENALLVERQRSHDVLARLRELGVRVSIDDFGTGYTSLAYLKQVPADELKIDKSFVMSMLADPSDARVVEQAVSLGHAFGLEVVAVGVESAEVAARLAEIGCDYVQGFHYAKPLAPRDFPAWAHDWRKNQ